MKKQRIIKELSKYWISRNVWFGDLIHKLKPNTIDQWKEYLVQNKFFFVKGMKYKKYERRYWIYYLKYSFWKLYVSETKAIEFFKAKYNINLIQTPHHLDVQKSYDFYFDGYFVIVKHGLYSFDFNSITEPNVFVFDSLRSELFNSVGEQVFV